LRYPAVRQALEELSGRISMGDMRQMNHAVDAGHQDPADVARAFLARLERERQSKG
jgi:glycine betaine/choline ABC-type transport system substrate-binding protein